jgi:chromosome segregation ATPase
LKIRVLALFILGVTTAGAADGVTPSASPSSPEVAGVLSSVEKTTLRRSFLRTLQNEVKALHQRHRVEMADLKSSQKARRNELVSARREFFKSNPEPAKRRAFMKDLVARRKALDQLLSAEWKGRKSDQKAAQASLREDQRRRLAEFDSALQSGRRPSDLLWTSPGM